MDLDKVGSFIKELRLKHNYTQKEFADILGVTSQAVSKWERGQGIPDISLLKDISEKFNVNINEILGEEKKDIVKKNNYILYIILIIIIVLGLFIGFYIHNNNHDFEFKTISTTCREFEINGSAAYNKDKTSIYISNIEYCGSDEDIEYKELTCTLTVDGKEISKCTKKNNITLKKYLKDLKLSVSDNKVCKNIKNEKLVLEINAIKKDGLNTVYKIPLKLDENC